MTRQLHAAALLTRLEASPGPLPLVALDGHVPDGTLPPYAAVHFLFRRLTASESPGTTSLTFESTTYQVDAYVHSVGTDARLARAVANRVEGQWLNWVPTVTSRTCTPMRQVDSLPANPDEQTGELTVDLVDVYRFLSVPA